MARHGVGDTGRGERGRRGNRGPDPERVNAAAAAANQTSPDPADIDWATLREAALAAAERAYAPYSEFAVGCAALVDDGRVVSGCNIENASYGLTLCAECTMIGALHMSGGGRLVAFDCVDAAGQTLSPCGRCRQLLFEAGVPGMLLRTADGHRTIAEMLPGAFGPSNLQR